MSIKELPQLIDAYADARQERLAAQRATDALASEENKFKAEIIALLQDNDLSTAGSARHSVKLKMDDKPIANDWDAIYSYIHETQSFDLLQRRLGERAIKLRWEDGVTIPGVTTFPVEKLTISKV